MILQPMPIFRKRVCLSLVFIMYSTHPNLSKHYFYVVIQFRTFRKMLPILSMSSVCFAPSAKFDDYKPYKTNIL